MKILGAEICASAADAKGFPSEGLPEIAFLGRSNVGKSSLLNRLVQRRALARTSSTPGKTRLIHFFRIEREAGALCFVDLPGYGYAQVSKQERARWQALVERYLSNRPVLRLALLLQDIRRDASDDERLLLAWLAERGVPARVVLTKADKLGAMQRAARRREIAGQYGMPLERLLPTSASRTLGIEELWREIDAAL